MGQTMGSNVRVRWDRRADQLNPKRTGQQLVRLEALVGEVAKLWLEALEAGIYPIHKESGGRGTGFSEADPTARAVLSPTQRQLRNKARRSAVLIEQAMELLEDAASTLHDGFLLTDDEVLERFLEKRRAAEQDT